MRHAMPLMRAEEKQMDTLLRLLLSLSLEQISFYSMRSPHTFEGLTLIHFFDDKLIIASRGTIV
jgi:hypothetical protein